MNRNTGLRGDKQGIANALIHVHESRAVMFFSNDRSLRSGVTRDEGFGKWIEFQQ
jgi:hypothetical protein